MLLYQVRGLCERLMERSIQGVAGVKEMTWAWVALLLAATAISLAVLLAATADRQAPSEDVALVRSFVGDWLRSKGLSPVASDGSIDSRALWRLGKRLVTGASGESEADAAADSLVVVSSIREGNKLMEEGRRERAPELMDRAIRLRPNDWTYRVSRGALALEKGDMEAWKTQMKAADNMVMTAHVDPLRYSVLLIDELEGVRGRLGEVISGNRDQCVDLFYYLAVYYDGRAKMTGSVDDEMMFHRYLGAMMACGGSGEGGDGDAGT